jgi:flagellar biosynthesis protein FliP
MFSCSRHEYEFAAYFDVGSCVNILNGNIMASNFNGKFVLVLLLLLLLLLLVIILLIITQFSSIVITLRLLLQCCI